MTISIGNSSSGIDASMLKKMQEQLFKKADKDGDGTISKAELSQMVSSSDSKNSSSVDELFKQMDSDNNGSISRLESDAVIAKAASQMQTQGMHPQGSPPPPPPQSEDTSSVSSTDSSTVYDPMDTNKDGKVSASELLAALAKSVDSSSESSKSTSMQKDFQTLSTALKSGNVSDAQTALAALQKDVSSHSGGQSSDPFSKDLQSLSDSLQSGNISDAQNIFADIQDKFKAGAHQPHGPVPESGQIEGSSSQDTVVKTLQALLDAVDKTSSATSSTSSSSDANAALKNIFTTALQSYLQQSSGSYAQSLTSGTVVSASV
jgi:Ca2+-binding EF-hand superfamily protein